MQELRKSYESIDTSHQGFPFESPYFPAFFRLLKWKIFDILMESTENSEYGQFQYFESLFKQGELKELVSKIKDETLPADPYADKIKNADIDGKMKRQAEAYAKMCVAHQFRVRRRRYVEYFLGKVLFSEEGLRIADKVVYNYNSEIYNMMHLERLPAIWPAAQTFKDRFYDPEKLTDPFSMQKLDQAAGCSRGNLILISMRGNQRCDMETIEIEKRLKDSDYQVKTDLVKSVLDEGPHYQLEKNADGDEVRKAVVSWTEHLTRLVYLTFPSFKENDKVERNEHEDWYYGLLEAMSGDPDNRAALYFLNKNYEEEIREIESQRERDRMLQLNARDHNEQIVEEVVTKIRPQPVDSSYQSDVEELELRNYQNELVQPALEGKNCVIVAPTGSGKTEVAIYAARNHIKEREARNLPARVVMLVPKIPLVSQQKERFLKYCRGRYHVEGFHGSEKASDGKGRRDDVLRAHVVVMTPQILVNMWQSVRQSERLYVSDFSMIVFDEVHKATGNHPYVEISRIVQEWEHDKPQIIGLTASLNVNTVAQTDSARMRDSIFEMLAILNTPHLSAITKQENINELNEHVGKPDDSVEICQQAPEENDDLRKFIPRILVLYHAKLLVALEELMRNRHNCFSPGTIANFKKAKPEFYEQYEAYLQNVIQDLNKLNMAEKGIATMYTKCIKIYVEARGIIEIMPSFVAFEYMEEAFSKLDLIRSLDQFKDFEKNKEALKMQLPTRRDQQERTEPDIVKKLKATLIGQFKANPESRVIIFVTQRSTAKRVCDFLNRSRIMDEFQRPKDEAEAVGYVLGTNNQGAVQQKAEEQQLNIEKFNTGRMKIMVATSVVEEGLDVTACNLIIKYNCSSGSAIQLVQQRGRARAKNSRSVLLAVSNSINEKENTALLSEKYMKQCVNQIMKSTQADLEANVNRLKKKLEGERLRDAKERENNRMKLENKLYRVTCASCSRLFCRSNVLKKIYSNYMIMDPQVWDHLDVVPKRKINKYLSEETQPLSILQCHKCHSDVGKAYKMRGVYLPQLDVGALAFHAENVSNDSPMLTKKKWSAVELELFYIGTAVQRDFEIMLSALSGSEESVKKKHILDIDSAQHIKEVERSRDARNRKEKEEKRRQNTIPVASRRADFSDEEVETQ